MLLICRDLEGVNHLADYKKNTIDYYTKSINNPSVEVKTMKPVDGVKPFHIII